MQTNVVTSSGHYYEDLREPSIASSISVALSHSNHVQAHSHPSRTPRPELTKTTEKAKVAISSLIGRAGHHDTVRQKFFYHERTKMADLNQTVDKRYASKNLAHLFILASGKASLQASSRKKPSLLDMKTA